MNSFLSEWEDSFRTVHNGLNLLSGYNLDQLGGFHPGPRLSFEQRILRQKEWINNIQGMEELDQRFFQKHWVPVQEDLAQWFIDLSNPQFPVFAPYFLDLEPKTWYINSIMNSLADFILAVDNGITRHELFKIESQGQLRIFSFENNHRNNLIFNGKIDLPSLTVDEVFFEGIPTQPCAPPEESDFFLFNALPLSIGLFPPETDISLNSVKCDLQSDEIAEDLELVTKLRHFVLFLRKHGPENFPEFQLDFIDPEVLIFLNEKKELIVIGLSEENRTDLLNRIKMIIQPG